jgi:lipooligosaccharide transport system permease protein
MAEVIDQVGAPVAARSIGRALGPVRSSLLVIESFFLWYRKNWRASLVTTVVNPFLFLVALGFGFGSQVPPGEATGGLEYVVYLVPGLLAATALQLGAFEGSYPVLGGFKWQQQYVAMATSPVTPAQIAAGHLGWIAVRIASAGVLFVVIAAVLGVLSGPAIMLAVPISVLTGMAMCAPVAAYSATLQNEAPFSGLFRFVVLPMSLFAGTFFPVDTLPVWIRPLAWITPLWHGTELARGVTFGWIEPLPALGHVAFLIAVFGVGAWLCARFFKRRLES